LPIGRSRVPRQVAVHVHHVLLRDELHRMPVLAVISDWHHAIAADAIWLDTS
jgi:hypothetical protein